MTNNKILLVALSVLFCLGAAGCSSSEPEEPQCEHQFYRSDYVAPTELENGYDEYTCLNCDKTYQEVIPAEGQAETKEESSDPSSHTLDLLSFPAYSSSDSTAIAHLQYEAEILDFDNWKHENCYQICCGFSDDCFRRWELNGGYSEVTGTIYMRQGNSNSYWLEFYDAEQLIFTTPRLSATNTKVEFSFDVTDVEFLTMYGRKEGATAGTWIIADPIQITTAE